MKTNLLVIQNSPTAPLGVLDQCIRDRAISREILTPSAGDRLSLNTSFYSGLIVLGGPMSAEDDVQYPHLRDVLRLIQLFSAENKPILGICLGAQLIARAFGQRVYQHSVAELGFTPLRPIMQAIAHDSLLKSALLSDLEPIHLMEWHFDTFDLPDEAELLMTGNNCQNQAYRIKDNIYGFQCHFEVDRAILQNWLINGRDYLQKNNPNFPEQLSKQIELYLSKSNLFCQQVCHAWLDLVELRENRSTDTVLDKHSYY